MRQGFGATTYTWRASGRCTSTAWAPRPTRTMRPCAAASAMIRSVTRTIVASSCSTRGTPAEATNSSGDAAASVRASRSSRPGARSSRWATSSGGSPARRATASTNSLSITSHSSCAATSRATFEPPEAYCRGIVMTGGAISGLQVLAEVPDVEQRQPAFRRHEDDQVVRALHVVQHLDPLLGEGLGGVRLIEKALLFGLQPGDLDAVPLGLDLLLLGDLVVDRLDHLSGRLQIAQEKRRDSRERKLAAPGARRGDECRIDQRLHGVRDLCALGDVVDGVLHHPVAHPLADGVQDGAADLILVADLGEDLGRLHRVDLPANRHLDVHPHLLAGERFDRLDLIATRGPLLFARRVALDRRPGRHEPDARQQGGLVYVPERVPHAHLAGVDDHDEGAGADHDPQDGYRESGDAQEVDDGPGTLRAEGGGAEQKEERDAEEDSTGDELAHGDSRKGRGRRCAPCRATKRGSVPPRPFRSSRIRAPWARPARVRSRALHCARYAFRPPTLRAPTRTPRPSCPGPSSRPGPPGPRGRAGPALR